MLDGPAVDFRNGMGVADRDAAEQDGGQDDMERASVGTQT